MNEDYVLLDTSAFDAAIAQKERLISEYQAVNDDFDRIVRELLDNWKGKGARAFADDAGEVRANITGIQEILKIMMDTLTDCKEVFQMCDTKLGEYNKNPS